MISKLMGLTLSSLHQTSIELQYEDPVECPRGFISASTDHPHGEGQTTISYCQDNPVIGRSQSGVAQRVYTPPVK